MKPFTLPKYKTVDWRTVVKCDQCKCWLETSDKAAHTNFHRMLNELLQAKANEQPSLLEPPF